MTIEIIDASLYAVERAICDKATAYWQSVTKGERNYLTGEEAAHPDYAACDNDMRGRVEQYEILTNPPESLTAYISGGKVTVWTGLPLSTQLHAGKSWRVGSYVGSTMTQYHAWIGGRQYTGRGLGEGMMINLRETAKSKRHAAFADSHVEEMTRHYVAALLWSSTDDMDTPLDCGRDISDLTDEFRESCRRDCWRFLYKGAEYLSPSNYIGRSESGYIAMAGHDFALTRNRHGAGFWDGDWKTDRRVGLEGPLTRLAQWFGEVDLYVTDDGKVSA